MGEQLDKFKQKFEWYRMCLPKKHREVFDRILEKSANDEDAMRAVPGQTDAIILNQMIDMEERLKKLENIF
jgi:hypothetical protein